MSVTRSKPATRLKEHLAADGVLADFFGNGTTIIPMPRSTPIVQGALWPADRIARIIKAVGLAERVVPTLERRLAVPKSSRASPGAHPSVLTHHDFFAVIPRGEVSDKIVLLDDVITKGATAMAALWRLHEVYSRPRIALFCAVRTKGLVANIDRILDPVVGEIRLVDGEPYRDP